MDMLGTGLHHDQHDAVATDAAANSGDATTLLYDNFESPYEYDEGDHALDCPNLITAAAIRNITSVNIIKYRHRHRRLIQHLAAVSLRRTTTVTTAKCIHHQQKRSYHQPRTPKQLTAAAAAAKCLKKPPLLLHLVIDDDYHRRRKHLLT